MPPKKITKKRIILGLIAGFITFVVLYILLPPIELKIEFYLANLDKENYEKHKREFKNISSSINSNKIDKLGKQ